MTPNQPETITHKQAQDLSRQLELIVSLLVSLADPHFREAGPPAQRAILKKRGFKTIDLVKAFGVTKQAVASGAKKKSKKK